MKRYGIFALAVSLHFYATLATATEPVRLSEPVESTDAFEIFGAPMPDKSRGASLSALIASGEVADGDPVRVTTQVTKVCQKKGCFFIASEGSVWARITVADYSFFVPTDSAGRTATLEGTFQRRTLSAREAAHYAADMGEAAAEKSERKPQFEYGIVATSVLLEND
jgi:hypothetical protein